ncbi:MAG: glutathione S-transferase family protein [Steroidobacteraceae bacterium]
MLILYIGNKNYSSWSLRPWVLMRELGIDFEEKLVPFAQPGEPSAFTWFSPTGKVPCLVDEGTTVWDTLGITEYLAERFPAVWPKAAPARAFARCASAEMHSGFATLRTICAMNCGLRIRLNGVPPALAQDLARLDALWQQGLARFGGPFLAGERFTAMDAFFAPVAFRLQTYSPPVSPIARDYAERLVALPSMRAWYAAALAEPWRETDHERETLQHGALVEDLRTG